MSSEKALSTRNQIFFYGLFALLAVAVLWLIGSYIGIIAFSLVMVIILKPVHRLLLRRLGNRSGLATVLTLLLFFAALIVPAWIVISVTANQLQTLAADLASGASSMTEEELRAGIDSYLARIPGMEEVSITDEQMEKARELAANATRWLSGVVVGLGASIPSLLAQTFIFLGIVGSLLPNYDKFVRRLLILNPLSDEIDRLYLRKLKAMVWSMFVGMFVIAIGQGLMMGILYWIAGIPYLAPLTLISTVAAMLPLGASVIAVPLGIVELLVGKYVPGLIVLAGYLLVVANVDNLIRPKLVSKEAYMSFAAVMVSALGGYTLFGFFGVIYGPVLTILFLTTVDVHQRHYLMDKIPVDRLRIMTKSMMLSIVVVALIQGIVTGLLMALAGTPHVIPLTIASIIMAILPGGAAFVAIPVGLGHIVAGDMWAGLLIILGALTFVSALANQIRPMLVSKDAYLNRAFVLLSVFSGIAFFGFMGIVYGPLIMILLPMLVSQTKTDLALT